jgi:hypothetical protein
MPVGVRPVVAALLGAQICHIALIHPLQQFKNWMKAELLRPILWWSPISTRIDRFDKLEAVKNPNRGEKCRVTNGAGVERNASDFNTRNNSV